MTRRALLLALVPLITAACGEGGLVACEKQSDLTGSWAVTVTPVATDGGPTLMQAGTIAAELRQVKPAGLLNLSRYLYGTLRAPDLFGTVQIPELTMNNGSKTGSSLGCAVQINVPLTSSVSDDNVDQGPLRVALGGTVVAPGQMTGDPARSAMILVGDVTLTPRSFAWNATLTAR